MQARTSNLFVILIVLVMIAIIVVLGFQGKSAWISVLAIAGTVFLFYAMDSAGKRRFGGFWIGAILGIAAMGTGIWIGHLAGRTWWAALFFLLGMAFISNAVIMKSTYAFSASIPSILIGLILLVSALGGPWWLYDAATKAHEVASTPNAEVAPAAAATLAPVPKAPPVERGDFFPGLWSFLLGSVKSGWGILYLALVMLLGRIWLGKWGWIIAPILLLLAAGGLAWSKPGGVDAMTAYFTTPPLDLIVAGLKGSARQFGSAAWGALLFGIGLVVLLLPAYIVMYAANRAMVRAQRVRQAFGTNIAADLLRASGQYTPFTSLVSLVTVAVSVTGFILIWKALVAISAASGPLAFPLLGVADVSLPRWKPIWQLPYFLNAGIYAIIGIALTTIQRRMGLALIAVNWFVILLGAFLLSLFIPAGVVCFLAGQSLALLLVSPLALLKKSQLREPPRRPAPVPEQQWTLEELRRALEQAEGAKVNFEEAPIPVPPPPALAPAAREEAPVIVGGTYRQQESELLIEHSCKIVEMIVDSQNRLHFLDVFGTVWHGDRDGEETELKSFDMDHPMGLAAISGGRIAAVDQSGKVYITGGAEPLATAQPVRAFTVNSFGTILAYTSPGSSFLRGLILAAGKDQLFLDCGERLTDVCFSKDNRYLGIGTADGNILIFDMASRKITQTIHSEGTQGVSHLCPGADGGWIAAYDAGEVTKWDSQGEVVYSWDLNKGNITCLAYNPEGDNVAFGTNLGEITILDANFDVRQSASLHDEDIVSAIFEPSGGSLITAGIDGGIRRIEF